MLAEAIGDQVDELLAAQDALHVLLVKDAFFLPGQTEGRAGDNDRTGQRQAAGNRRLCPAGGSACMGQPGIDAASLLQKVGKQLAQGYVAAVIWFV